MGARRAASFRAEVVVMHTTVGRIGPPRIRSASRFVRDPLFGYHRPS